MKREKRTIQKQDQEGQNLSLNKIIKILGFPLFWFFSSFINIKLNLGVVSHCITPSSNNNNNDKNNGNLACWCFFFVVVFLIEGWYSQINKHSINQSTDLLICFHWSESTKAVTTVYYHQREVTFWHKREKNLKEASADISS